MKRFAIILLVLAMVLGMVGCDNKTESNSPSSSTSSSNTDNSSSKSELSQSEIESKAARLLYKELKNNRKLNSGLYDLDATRYSITSVKEDTRNGGYDVKGSVYIYTVNGKLGKSGTFQAHVGSGSLDTCSAFF